MNSLLTLFSFAGNVCNCGDYDVYINFLMFFAMCKTHFYFQLYIRQIRNGVRQFFVSFFTAMRKIIRWDTSV